MFISRKLNSSQLVHEELAGAGAGIADRVAEREGGVPQPASQGVVDRRRGRFLQHLLVATLDRAISLAEVNAVADGVEEHLDLDVAATLDEPLEDQPTVTKRRRRLAPRSGQAVRQPVRLANDAHPLAATAGRRLDQDREADPLGGERQRRVRLVRVVVPGEDRNPERPCESPCGSLVAHRQDRGRRRTHPGQAGTLDGFGEAGVLGQEAEARVDRVSARRQGRVDDRVTVEEVQGIGSVGGRRDGVHPEPPAGPRDAGRDLAAIGDEHGANRPPADFRRGTVSMSPRERVNRVNRDAPTAADASGRQPPTGDPALHGSCRGANPRRGLAWTQLVAHGCRDCRTVRIRNGEPRTW